MRNATALVLAVLSLVVVAAFAPVTVAGADVGTASEPTRSGSAVPESTDTASGMTESIDSTAELESSNDTAATRASMTATTDLELQEAFEGSTDSSRVSLRFTPSENKTVEAERQDSDGEVTFTYTGWTGGGSSGSSSTFEVEAGETYTVYYDAVGESRGEQGFDTTRSVDVTVSNVGSGTLSADVDYVSPSFGRTDAPDGKVLFEGQSERETRVDVEFWNDGQGDMNVQDVTVSADSDVSASVRETPSRVDAGQSGSMSVVVTVDESANEGPKDVSVVVEDNLGNRETIRFDVNVRKATRVTADEDTYNVGGVLRGESVEVPVELVEQTGYDDANVDIVRAIGAGPNASLRISGLDGDVPAGGSESGRLRVSVNERSPQHEELSWLVRLEPTTDSDAEATTFQVDARTFYPAAFGGTSASSVSYTFDEERGASEYTRQVETNVENTGDLPLSVDSISVRSPDFDDSYVSAEVTRGPERVPGTSSRDYILDVTVDSRAPEGTHTLVVEYGSSNASAGTETVQTEMEIDHETRVSLGESALSFGRLEITRADTRTVSVSEALGYNDVRNLTLERVDGPDEGWVTVERGVPSTLTAGESSDVVFGLQFNTEAEVLTEYEWTFRVDGSNVDAQTVTITAEPGLIDAQETKDRLSAYAGESGTVGSGATTMTEMLTRLESKIEGGDLESGTDISRAFTAAQTYVTFINATEQTRAHLEAGEHDAAQEDLTRASSTYNTVSLYVAELSDDELSRLGDDALDDGNTALNDLIETQRAHYQQQLSSDDTSLLDAAIVKRELARIAVLQGEESRANTLQSAADRAFEQYAENVSAGQESLQSARSTDGNLTAAAFTVVEGQPLLLNPADLGAFQSKSDAVLSSYVTARERFEAAGESETAAEVADEREATASDYQTAETALYVASAGYLVAFLALVVHLLRGVIAYISDAKETATGEFLV
ncbi:hypothetical protein [Halorubellus sp. PRR65]|uniref:hypothetical protein n=1 Tax=Halorubellus sp. PRR65 TaxID=3098148 RepID=UPI002B2583EB|nr:hypothetical protein [Halorubellus sp. PRR65]